MQITIQQAADALLQMDRVVFLCHRSPDGDTLGSAYGLCRALRLMGKQARVACSDPLPAKMAYLAEGLEEQDFTGEHIVSVDIADENLFGGGLESFKGRVELAVDHHLTHRAFAQKICLRPDMASTCEIVYEIVMAMGAPLTPEVASCLYTGTATDTGCFKYSSVTPHTHLVSASLIEAGCDHKNINKVMFDTKTLAVIGIERDVLSGLELYEQGKIALITVTLEMLEREGLTESDLDGISALPRKIEGVIAGVTVKERKGGEHKISLRTTEEMDASAICALFGGGGHARAAGCSFPPDASDYKEKLLAALRGALPQN